MKKLLIGLLFMGLTSLTYAQATAESIAEMELEGITLLPANLSYLSVVSSGTEALRVIKLQKVAASFDITQAASYDKNAKYHEFSFDQEFGHIYATYDRNGRIVRSDESYKDVILLPPTRNSIYSTFPDWEIVGNKYEVLYKLEGETQKVYKIKLKNGNKRKRVKIDPQGKIL
ncbi:hypothetical protein [Muriicola sp. Z0-33]|uniref:hypothetical protein n=1 Tax=Muriicola sp. Z0-33 TaxID=2816957 RepID=UPI002237F5F0|nr:hypothetical protein [Muriicola sp. Z0-33]MCW5516246.1 hypothetical protein [Muriicola sp. Z0-33]